MQLTANINWFLISAYNNPEDKDREKFPSVIYALEKESGKFVAQFNLYNVGKNDKGVYPPCTAHVGGIAVSEYNLYSTYYNNTIAYIPLSELEVEDYTVKDIKFTASFEVMALHEFSVENYGKFPATKDEVEKNYTDDEMLQRRSAKTAYVEVCDGILWTGNFFDNTTETETLAYWDWLPSSYRYKATKDYNSVIVGYNLFGGNSSDEWKNLKKATKEHYRINLDNDVDAIQGVTFEGNNLFLSKTEDASFSSKVRYATVDINKSNFTLTLDDFNNAYKNIDGAEEITIVDGTLYSVYESAALFIRGDAAWSDILKSVSCNMYKVNTEDLPGYKKSPSTNPSSSSNTRYSVLVLDVSGSMRGSRITEVKKAAKGFCSQVLNSANGDKNFIAITTFAASTEIICSFSDNLNRLTQAIDSLEASGNTDLAGGIRTGSALLSNVDNKAIKNIFVMSDGAPTTGENNAYNAVEEIPLNWNIYGLYFCPGGVDNNAAKVMKNVGRNGYWEVDDGDKIYVVFSDTWSATATTKNVNNIVITIACPVDVSVELNGIILNKNNPKTLFGTIEFEGTGNDEIKTVKLSYNDKYIIKAIGNGAGTMNYSVSYRCNDEELYSLTYPTINITPDTVVTGKIDFEDKTITLDVDNDGDGNVDRNISPGSSKLTFLDYLAGFFGFLITPFVTIFGLIVSFFVILFGGATSLL